MLMDMSVQIPMELIKEVSEFYRMYNCIRKQAVFQLFPGGKWEYYFVCGTNKGIGSDDGYGVGHTCTLGCSLKMYLPSVDTNEKRS